MEARVRRWPVLCVEWIAVTRELPSAPPWTGLTTPMAPVGLGLVGLDPLARLPLTA